MLEIEWSKLGISPQQFGAFGEHYARALLMLYGCRTYAPDIDDHGIDLLVETHERILKMQIKTIRLRAGYVFMKERDFCIQDSSLYLFLIVLTDGLEPSVYLIPANAWTRTDKPCFVYHAYDTPEYGVNISVRSMAQLEEYQLQRVAPVVFGKRNTHI